MQRPPLPGVSLFRRFCCYLGRPPAPHGSLRHLSLPGVSLFRRFCCYLDRPPAPHGSLRHPSPPGVSRFRRIGSHLRRVTRYPALWQRAPAPDAPLKRGISFAKTRRFRAADYSPRPAPVRRTSAVRGTSRCAPGAFSLTAPVFRSSRAQKGAWCARDGAAERRHVGTGGGSTIGRSKRQQARTSTGVIRDR